MATFEGTIAEFIHFFGNNLLSNAASKYAEEYKKIIVKKCEWKKVPGLENLKGKDCQCDTKHPREAAHKHECNKLLIAIEILKRKKYQNPEKKGFIKVDFNEFLNDFYIYHKPISDSFYTLCKRHHEKYDHPDEKSMPDLYNQKLKIDDDIKIYKEIPYTKYGIPENLPEIYVIDNVKSTDKNFRFTHAFIKKLVKDHPGWNYNKLFEVIGSIHTGTKNRIVEKFDDIDKSSQGIYNTEERNIIELGNGDKVVVLHSIRKRTFEKVIYLYRDIYEFGNYNKK